MKQIVIIGGSPAAIKAAEDVRAVDQASSITIILWEEFFPYNRQAFPLIIAGETTLDKNYLRNKNFYEQNQINFIADKQINRINFKRSQVIFEDKSKLDYDFLILSDLPQTKLPDVKGNHRAGVFGLRKITEVNEVLKSLAVAQTIALQSQTLAGLRWVCALRKRDKEVLWITPEERILSGFIDADSAKAIRALLEEGGVRVIEQNEIAEVLGDAEAKAVRLKSGKVIAAQLVFWPDAAADLKIFKETELQFDERVTVNSSFQTNISNVFAVDDMASITAAQPGFNEDQFNFILEQQGRIVAAAINGQGLAAEGALRSFSGAIQNLSLHLIGDTMLNPRIRTASLSDLPSKVYKRIFVEGETVVGAVLINADSDLERFKRLIKDRTNISGERGGIWDELQRQPAIPEAPNVIVVPHPQSAGQNRGEVSDGFPVKIF